MHEAYQPVIEDGRGRFPEDLRVKAPRGARAAIAAAAQLKHTSHSEYVCQSARSLKNVVFGTAEKLVPGEQSHKKYANAVRPVLFKKTLAEDPVGFAADLATLLSGGELALARAPGVVGQIGRVAGTVGRAVDPINAAAGGVAKGVGHVGAAIGGVTTGVGGSAIREAARTGFEGGEAGTSRH